MEEAVWTGERLPNGVYKDPKNPARFFRRGRGGKPASVKRRWTLYVPDELSTEVDVFIARKGSSEWTYEP